MITLSRGSDVSSLMPSDLVEVIAPALKQWFDLDLRGRSTVLRLKPLPETRASALYVTVKSLDAGFYGSIAFEGFGLDGELFIPCSFDEVAASPYVVCFSAMPEDFEPDDMCLTIVSTPEGIVTRLDI